MSDALEDQNGSVSIGCRMFINFRFADDIDFNAEEEEEADKTYLLLLKLSCCGRLSYPPPYMHARAGT